jgi:hypothetical protein
MSQHDRVFDRIEFEAISKRGRESGDILGEARIPYFEITRSVVD